MRKWQETTPLLTYMQMLCRSWGLTGFPLRHTHYSTSLFALTSTRHSGADCPKWLCCCQHSLLGGKSVSGWGFLSYHCICYKALTWVTKRQEIKRQDDQIILNIELFRRCLNVLWKTLHVQAFYLTWSGALHSWYNVPVEEKKWFIASVCHPRGLKHFSWIQMTLTRHKDICLFSMYRLTLLQQCHFVQLTFSYIS